MPGPADARPSKPNSPLPIRNCGANRPLADFGAPRRKTPLRCCGAASGAGSARAGIQRPNPLLVLAKRIGLGQHRETRGQRQVRIEVRSVSAGAAIAAWISAMLLLSACSGEITPERAAAAYPPQPVIFP